MELTKLTRPRLGLLDAFAGPHGVDGFLEQINPLLARRTCRARVVRVDRKSPESVTLTLEPNRAWQGFRAGQFIQLGVEIDGVRHRRCYSPASAERHRPVELTIKRHPEGLVSNFIADTAEVGKVFDLRPAEGTFHLPRPRPESVLMIGGGSGLTPLTAMVRTLISEGHSGPITLLHYAPDPERAIYGPELSRLAADHPHFTLLRSYTRAPDLGEIDGHFDRAHLPDTPSVSEAETYACGPPSLLEAVRKAYSGRREELFRTESFLPPVTSSGRPGEGTVTFSESGIEIENSGTNLLEQAEAAGLRPRYGCRMGICHTCTRRKETGTHENLVTGEISSTPDEEIQPCVSAALGDIAIKL